MANNMIILYDRGFPDAEGLADKVEDLRKIGRVVDGEGLTEVLRGTDGGCFVNLHAPYFPKAAWQEITAYLERGGGLLNVGGAPFKVPLYKKDGEWLSEVAQTSYHQQLGIHEAMPVDPDPITRLTASEDIPVLAADVDALTVEPTYSLILHVTRHNDQPHESGSAGPMDAHLYPLVKGISRDGREVAAPVVLLENTKGTFAGGRWLFVNQRLSHKFWSGRGAQALAEWAAFCSRGVTDIWLTPNYACWEPGDKPKLRLQLQSLRSGNAEDGEANTVWTLALTFSKRGAATVLWEDSFTLSSSQQFAIHPIHVPVELESGLYDIRLTAVSDRGEIRTVRQGIWGMDRALLSEGEPLTRDRDYFRRNGKPFPIVGMTYMTSDVARKFVFLPNVAVWDRDMAAMRKAGINLIRTGFWTGFRHIMYADGHPSEEILRALDAFFLTAKKHDLEVTFNFFAFTPETWEGSNPYLDPRSVEAQKRMIAAIVSRHKDTVNVHWDLINEPSMFDPKRIFSTGPRSARDPYERAAYVKWLKQRHASIDKLQERWGMTALELPEFDAVVPPEANEINFDIMDMVSVKRGTRWLDFTLFSMYMLNEWAGQLSGTIRSFSGDRLITIGQDEALGSRRPSPFFYEAAVDYTTNHSWWLMDDLVWDGIFSKTPNKPNLIQETGIMYVETPDGRAKRSETELRNILERKYAYAFSTGGAGAVQWIWNTNYYMHNVNESNIGALRADGTEKPEANVSYDFGEFMPQIAHLLEDRRLEETLVIYPYSNDFSNRPLVFEATTRLTRVLAYELNIPFRALGEYELDTLRLNPPKLIIVPSAHNFSEQALSKLINHVEEHGGTLLITGPVGLNEYWHPTNRLVERTGPRNIANVLREEVAEVAGQQIPLAFGGSKIGQLFKEVAAESTKQSRGPVPLQDIPLGKGRLLWLGLPAELNDRTESTREFYRWVLREAGVQSELQWIQGGELPGVYGRKLTFREGALFIFVSEYACDAEIAVKDPQTGKRYTFMLESERTVMFAADADGAIVSVYRPQQVEVQTV